MAVSRRVKTRGKRCPIIGNDTAQTCKEAQQQYPRVREIKLPYAQIDRAQAENAPTGFLKLVLAGKKDEIVGAHIVGAQASELLARSL